MNKSGENGITFDKTGKPMIFNFPTDMDRTTAKQGFKYRVRKVEEQLPAYTPNSFTKELMKN